jgi:DNA ligase-1
MTKKEKVKVKMKNSAMLAHTWVPTKIDPKGWLMSEKLDGVRATFSNGIFRTRTGRLINVPRFFKTSLPKHIILDGEIFGGYGTFDKTSGICRKKEPVVAEWKTLSYAIFDVIDFQLSAFERNELLYKNIPKDRTYHKVLPQIMCKGRSHVRQFLKKIESRGGEGVMLKKGESMYESKRSHSLLKLKSFKDMDVCVIDHTKGTGKNKRKLGAIVCQMPSGKRFKCGSGFTDAQRENPPKLGSLITIKYFELTKGKIPRFPTYVGIRAEQDLHSTSKDDV